MGKTLRIKLNHKYEDLYRDYSYIRYVLVSGGRGSGKSYATSLYLANKFFNSTKNAIYLRQYMTNADSSTIPQFLSQVSELNLSEYFVIKHGEIQNHKGHKLYFRGFKTASNNADSQLKSIPNIDTVLIEEATEVSEADFDKLDYSVRDKDSNPKIILAFNPSHVNHWIFKRFYLDKGVPEDYNGVKDNVLYIHTTYLDNLEHLDESFLKAVEEVKESNILKYDNRFLGMWLKDNAYALWTSAMIEDAKKTCTVPTMYDSVCVGVDPAVTSNVNSDETGLIVVGRKDDQYYVLNESTDRYTPKEWADKVKELYTRYNADTVVVEVNQGGDLCIENIRNVAGDFIKIEKVRATKGKILRAEPVSALYEMKKVHHICSAPKLEYEMMTYTGDPKDVSPNSLDALTWAVTYLANYRTDTSGF